MHGISRATFRQTTLATVVGAALILFVTVVGSRVAVHMQRETEAALIQRLGEVYLDGLSAAVAPHAQVGRERELRAALERVARYHDGVREVRIVVRDADGRVLGDLARDDVAAAAPLPERGTELALSTTSDRNRVWVQRGLDDTDHDGVVLSAQLDLRPIRDEGRRSDLKSFVVNILLAAGFAFVGHRLIARLLRPIGLLERALERAADGEPKAIDLAGEAVTSPRMRHLVATYNRMAAALRGRRQAQIADAEHLRAAALGRLAATIAHEVRNPLAGMFNAVDTARRFADDRETVTGSLALIERGLHAIGTVVDRTLSFHRAPDQGGPLTPIDVADLEQLIAPLAAHRSVVLEWRTDLASAVPIDGALVRQIVLNLAINAVQAAQSPGTVSVTVARRARRLQIAVADDGDGLADETVRRLESLDIDRLDTTEKGIGLTVVVRAVASLGGAIAVLHSAAPRRTTIRLSLPLPPSLDEETPS